MSAQTDLTYVRQAPAAAHGRDRDAIVAGLPFFFRMACRIAERIRYCKLTFVLPDGTRLTYEGDEDTGAEGVIQVKDFDFARRTILGGDVGFFESYRDGQWETPNIADCLYVFARNVDHVQDAFIANPLVEFVDRIRHFFNRNTKSGSKRNIVAHYDLGNEFYEKWLDQTMTYSSAMYPDDLANLATAQTYKYERLARSIDASERDHILEIGSGWGGFAEHVAKTRGAKVTGITLSPSQMSYAQERAFRQGLADKMTFRLCDYRDLEGQFDKIASIEMFEAVGREYWPAYFDKIRSALKPGGAAGLQVITIADRLFDGYIKSVDFIQRYVFPGGVLPSPSILKRHIGDAGLKLESTVSFGQDYGRTLREWEQRFSAAWDEIEPIGFDDRFRRLWRFYLGYCEAGFRAATTDVSQITVRAD